MKKIFIFLIIILTIISTYMLVNHDEDLVFSIGANVGDINYVPDNYRITDIIIDIENNKKISGLNIQNLLVRATYINLKLEPFLVLKDYASVLSQITDLESLLKVIRKYTKEEIYIMLLEEKNILSEYVNKKVILLSQKYDIIIVR